MRNIEHQNKVGKINRGEDCSTFCAKKHVLYTLYFPIKYHSATTINEHQVLALYGDNIKRKEFFIPCILTKPCAVHLSKNISANNETILKPLGYS
jgi:hypothetical protein